MKVIENIVSRIKTLTQSRKDLAKDLRNSFPAMALKVPDTEMADMKICGVDGGFLKKEYHGLNLIIRRAVAVCFNYENGQLIKASYFPKKNPLPEPIVLDTEMSEVDFSTLANLKRVEKEIETAALACEKFKPDVLILDGSVVPHPSSTPSKSNDRLYGLFLQVMERFRDLYHICEQNNTLLVGVSEDSRAKKFCNQLAEKTSGNEILKTTNDTLFLCYFLQDGERTQYFKYSEREELPTLQELGSWAGQIYGMYLKPVKYDRPFRIDFLSKQPEEDSDRIAQILQSISKGNRTYAYPSVLIEADARAKLKDHEIGIFKKAIEDQIGFNPALFELRREQRPF